MRSHDFLASVHDHALSSLPEELRGHRFRIVFGMLQIYFAEPRIHYEVWLVQKTGRIEIGLHLEADRETNESIAVNLAEMALEARETLGPEAELEHWTSSWTRLHVTVPLSPLDEVLSRDVAARLSSLVRLTGDRIARLHAAPNAGQVRTVSERNRHWRHRGRSTAASPR